MEGKCYGAQLINAARANAYEALGEYASALAEYEKVTDFRERSRSFPMARLAERLGQTARASELYDEAWQLAQELGESSRRSGIIARIHAARGQAAAARTAIDDALRLALNSRDAQQISQARPARAEALTILGDHDAAVTELRTAHDMGLALGHTTLNVQRSSAGTSVRFLKVEALKVERSALSVERSGLVERPRSAPRNSPRAGVR